MNSAFLQGQAAALVKTVQSEPDSETKIRALYRRVLSRDPSQKELALAADYLKDGKTPDPWVQYAQALLATNEEIFWP
jgi:hypothetical protein